MKTLSRLKPRLRRKRRVRVYSTPAGGARIVVGRRVFVAGLFWQVLEGRASPLSEARTLAKDTQRTTGDPVRFVSLNEGTAQTAAGFAMKATRARRGMYSLAAVAAESLGPNVVAAFELGEGRYATVAAIRGVIVPESDKVVDATEARATIAALWREHSGSVEDGQMRLYAPQAVLPDAEDVSLEQLAKGAHRQHQLRALQYLTPKEALSLLAVAGAVVAAGWGLSAYYEYQEAQQRAEEARRQAELERLRRESGMDAQQLSLLRPWTAQPGAVVFARTCMQALWRLPVTIDGWAIAQAQCTQTAVKAKYSRTIGRTVAGFRERVQQWLPEAANAVDVSVDANAATISLAVTMPPGGDDPLAPHDERIARLATHLQRQVVPLELAAKASSLAPGYQHPPDSPLPPPTPDWMTTNWSVKRTERSPAAFLAGLPAQGVRITSIEAAFDADGRLQWSVSGDLYGQ